MVNSRRQKTLQQIFVDPPLASVPWADVEALFVALGAQVKEGSGSRVRVLLKGEVAVFHRPHPEKETDRGALLSVRKFLTKAGVAEGQ